MYFAYFYKQIIYFFAIDNKQNLYSFNLLNVTDASVDIIEHILKLKLNNLICNRALLVYFLSFFGSREINSNLISLITLTFRMPKETLIFKKLLLSV